MIAPKRIWANQDGSWMPHDNSDLKADPSIEYITRAEAEAMVRSEREACAHAMATLSAELSAAGRTEASGSAILAMERIRARGE